MILEISIPQEPRVVMTDNGGVFEITLPNQPAVYEVIQAGPQGAPYIPPTPAVYNTAPVHIAPGDFYVIVDLTVKGDALIVMPSNPENHEYVVKWDDDAHVATFSDPNGNTFDKQLTTQIDGGRGWKGLILSGNDWKVIR